MKMNNRHAFSLVEVCIALGVVSFSLIAVLGLIPVGLQTSKTATDQTAAASIMAAIHSDLRTMTSPSMSTTQRYHLAIPATGGTSTIQTLFFPGGSDPISAPNVAPPANASPLYRATVYLTAPSTPGAPTVGRVQITWPALADLSPGTAPLAYSGSMDAPVGLIRN